MPVSAVSAVPGDDQGWEFIVCGFTMPSRYEVYIYTLHDDYLHNWWGCGPESGVLKAVCFPYFSLPLYTMLNFIFLKVTCLNIVFLNYRFFFLIARLNKC